MSKRPQPPVATTPTGEPEPIIMGDGSVKGAKRDFAGRPYVGGPRG